MAYLYKQHIRKDRTITPTRKEICIYDMDFNLIMCYISIGKAETKNGISQGNLTTYLNKPIITKQNKLRNLGVLIWKYKN